MPIASWALIRPGPSTVTIAIARIRLGKDSTTSMIRIRTLSSQPPKKPAMAPMNEPMMIAKPTVRNPIWSEMRAP